MSFYDNKPRTKIPKILGLLLFFLFSSLASLIVSSALPDNTVNAASCGSNQTSKSTYSLVLGSGNIIEQKTGWYNEASSRGTNCVQYGSGNESGTTTFSKTTDKRYEAVGVTCGPVITFVTAPTTAGSKPASLQNRTTSRGDCVSSGSSTSINVTATGSTSSGVCNEAYALYEDQGTINAQVCKSGVLSSKTFTKNSTDPRIYDYAEISGRTCSQAAKITLTTASPTGSTVEGSYQAYKTAGDGTCTISDGAARRVTVSVKTLDCSALGSYSAVGCSFAQQRCEASGAANSGQDSLDICLQAELTVFKGYVDQCTAGAADEEAIINCLIEKAPIVASQLRAQLSGSSSQSSCTIEGIGWILCPVINFLAEIADQSFNFLADSFLRTDPNVFNTSSPTYQAWTIMRNIANILFVIAFLVIVFSQLTGVGVSNYGVKKLLPRIVIAAILVNVSYFISQLAIDVSNILGYSIRDMFTGVAAQVDSAALSTSAGDLSAFATGSNEGFVGTAGIIIGGGIAIGALYLMLSAFTPILIAAVLALLLILFILVARQAIIVLLVVLSPLAFVAFLLPNTEKLFKQWRKMLTAMLMLFPIIALVFGASTLASVLLRDTFTGTIGGGDSNVFGQIIGSAVLILPLFAVPILLKKSLDGIPVIGQMASKMVGRAYGNTTGKVKEGYKNSYVGKGAALRKQASQVYMDKRFAKGASGRGLAGLGARGLNVITPKGRYARATVGRVAQEAEDQSFEKEVKEAASTQRELSTEEATKYAKSGKGANDKKLSEVEHAALVDRVMTSGSFNQRREVLEYMASNKGSTSLKLRDRAVKGAYAKGDQNIYGTDFGDKIVQQGGVGTINSAGDLARQTVSNVGAGSFSAEHFVQGEGSTDYVATAVKESQNDAAKANLIQAGALAQSNESTKPKFTTKIKGVYSGLLTNSPVPGTNQPPTPTPTPTPAAPPTQQQGFQTPRRSTRPAGPPTAGDTTGNLTVEHDNTQPPNNNPPQS